MYSPQALQSKISRLQHDRLVGLMESISLFIVAFMFLGVIPQLIVRVLYPDQFPEQLPASLEMFLEYSPTVAVAVAVAYFVAVIVRNFARGRMISALEQDLEFASSVDGLGQKGEDWLSDLDTENWETPEETVMPAATKTTKKTGRKPGRKSSKKSA
jgi:hypothetical protein